MSWRLSRTHVLQLAAVLAASFTVPNLTAAAEKPNLIYIMVDDLGYGDLGCYGQRRIKTPSIDRLAAEGLRFTDHYAGSTVCAPSRCVLMTGKHTGHARIRSNTPGLMADEDVTVAEVLRGVGYRTGVIGKWGIGHPPPPGDPARNGFDYFYGYLDMWHAHNFYPEFLFRNGDKVPLAGNRVPSAPANGSGVAVERAQYTHDLFAAEALQFVERNRDRPFFLYLALNIPHANNEAGRRGMEVPDYGRYADLDWPEPQKGHAAMITRMDADVGRLIAKLAELGLEENTLVLFTSDNGPHREGGADPDFNNSNGPLRGIKRDLYEGGIRVPLIARWPGKVAPGTTTDHASAFWDFLPTACELAGAESPKGIDGISYLPTLLGDASRQKQHDHLYWEFQNKPAVRQANWKAVRLNPSSKIELYDLDNDLGETTNIAADNPTIVERMTRLIEAAHVDVP
ncbi:MAG TPA: arylsulfatase [Thermoguttaceae bacterium]|nr:arylsulfatase [Thermoguttaceae bacterium]